MARPVNADPAETRARIIAAAARLFAQSGPSAVSMRKIAAAASTTAATLHHYFGNKEGLYEACIDAMYARIKAIGQELAAALVQPKAPPHTVIGDGIRKAFRAAQAHRDVVRLVSRQVLDDGESAAPRRTAAVTALLTLADPYLERSSPLAAADRRSMLYSFMLLFNRAVLLEPKEVRRIWPAGDVEAALTDAFMRMLCIPEA